MWCWVLPEVGITITGFFGMLQIQRAAVPWEFRQQIPEPSLTSAPVPAEPFSRGSTGHGAWPAVGNVDPGVTE